MATPIAHVEVILTQENVHKEFGKVLSIIRPSWAPSEFRFKISSKNADNGIVKCYSTSSRDDTIIIRMYSEDHDTLTNNSSEVAFIKLVHERYGFAPKIIASFTNGIVYEFVNGKFMTLSTITMESNWRLVAKQVALLHSTEVEESLHKSAKISDLYTTIPEDYPIKLKNADFNERFQNEFPTRDEVIPEITDLIDHVLNIHSPVVLCHNNLRPNNIIWNKETGEITFVGFQDAGFSFQAQDIAFHFWKFVGENPLSFDDYPNRNFQIRWLRCYLEHWYEYTARDPNSVTHRHVEKLFVQVNSFYLLFLYQSLAEISIFDKLQEMGYPTDIFDVALASYKEYLRLKDEILNLALPNVSSENTSSFTGWCVGDFDSAFIEAMYANRRTTISERYHQLESSFIMNRQNILSGPMTRKEYPYGSERTSVLWFRPAIERLRAAIEEIRRLSS
uniref:ethanolamine kinase n=1 Tax=Strigamia maritima TaxID=126957 RepID=T1J824_STRMM